MLLGKKAGNKTIKSKIAFLKKCITFLDFENLKRTQVTQNPFFRM